MKREIKFRSWSETYQKMLCVTHLYLESDLLDGIDENEREYRQPNPQKKGVLMQYTELKDKKGEEIYEGDIIKGVHHIIGEWISKVDMLATGVWYGGARFTELDDVEIIGNIYETPELLTAKLKKTPYSEEEARRRSEGNDDHEERMDNELAFQ